MNLRLARHLQSHPTHLAFLESLYNMITGARPEFGSCAPLIPVQSNKGLCSCDEVGIGKDLNPMECIV